VKIIKADARVYLRSAEFKAEMAKHGGEVQLVVSDMPYNQKFIKGKAAPHDLLTKDDMSLVHFLNVSLMYIYIYIHIYNIYI
jgi:hypothetical protein